MKVLIIGAGGFGKHHTFSLSQFNNELYIVDPSEVARKTVEPMLNHLSYSFACMESISTDIKFDFCIIATNASIRVEQLIKVKSRFQVSKYLLEKIIINSIEDYDRILTLDVDNVYVNYARRAYPFYQALKNSLRGYDNIDVMMEGGDNSLLCNSMHYIDIFEYLTESTILNINVFLYGQKESKRKGYVDSNGIVIAKNQQGMLVQNSNTSKSVNVFKIMSGNQLLLEYNERQGVYTDNLELNWTAAIALDQSTLTQSILESELVCCAKLGEVIHTNKVFIEELLSQDCFKNMKRVPIT